MKHRYDKFDNELVEKRKRMSIKKQESKHKIPLHYKIRGCSTSRLSRNTAICMYQFLLDASGANIDYNDGMTVSNLADYI